MRKINTVTVVGAGYMGGGIAQVLALNGFQVQIADVDADATRAALQRLDKEAKEFGTGPVRARQREDHHGQPHRR